jgi:hypothetical protein
MRFFISGRSHIVSHSLRSLPYMSLSGRFRQYYCGGCGNIV